MEDFVIPRNEKVSQFQVRDKQSLADRDTRVSQASEERTVRRPSPLSASSVMGFLRLWQATTVTPEATEQGKLEILHQFNVPDVIGLFCRSLCKQSDNLWDTSGNHNLNFILSRDIVWNAQVHLDRPQETLMWENFARCIRNIKGGGGPDEFWPKIAALTQKVVLAIEESARNDCRRVSLSL